MNSTVSRPDPAFSSFDRLALAAWAGLAASALAIRAGFWTLDAQGKLPLCLFKAVTGIPCPGCGMAHALILAFQGKWASSFRAHPLGIPLLALWSAWIAYGAANRLRGKGFSEGFPRLSGVPAAATLALILSVYVVRLTAGF